MTCHIFLHRKHKPELLNHQHRLERPCDGRVLGCANAELVLYLTIRDMHSRPPHHSQPSTNASQRLPPRQPQSAQIASVFPPWPFHAADSFRLALAEERRGEGPPYMTSRLPLRPELLEAQAGLGSARWRAITRIDCTPTASQGNSERDVHLLN